MNETNPIRPAGGVPAWFPRGLSLLREPTLNKGTAFSAAERDALGLRGLLPPHICTQEEQEARVLENFRRKTSDLEKYINLNALHDRNEALFFRLVIDHPDEMLPIIYTPTVGLACQQFGHIFQRPRGLFVSAGDRGRIASVLAQLAVPGRARSSSSPTASGSSASATSAPTAWAFPSASFRSTPPCAGVHPTQCLPVILDVGTNNETLRNDPLYIGLQQPRLTGEAYDAFVEEFIAATQEVFPGVVVQFEDFANHNAFRLLAKYRDRICTFNDDIQGTAAVALSGILSALRVTGGTLGAQKLLFMGAGEAATGIADLVVEAMVRQGVPRPSRARALLARRLAGPRHEVTNEPRAAQDAVRPRARADHRLPGRDQVARADGDHRRRGGRRHVHAGGGRGNGARSTGVRSCSRCRTRRRSPNARRRRPTSGAAAARCSLRAARSTR